MHAAKKEDQEESTEKLEEILVTEESVGMVVTEGVTTEIETESEGEVGVTKEAAEDIIGRMTEETTEEITNEEICSDEEGNTEGITQDSPTEEVCTEEVIIKEC